MAVNYHGHRLTGRLEEADEGRKHDGWFWQGRCALLTDAVFVGISNIASGLR